MQINGDSELLLLVSFPHHIQLCYVYTYDKIIAINWLHEGRQLHVVVIPTWCMVADKAMITVKYRLQVSN